MSLLELFIQLEMQIRRKYNRNVKGTKSKLQNLDLHLQNCKTDFVRAFTYCQNHHTQQNTSLELNKLKLAGDRA